jgi:hypothetical protein
MPTELLTLIIQVAAVRMMQATTDYGEECSNCGV